MEKEKVVRWCGAVRQDGSAAVQCVAAGRQGGGAVRCGAVRQDGKAAGQGGGLPSLSPPPPLFFLSPVPFYVTTCPKAESIVKSMVQSHLNSDPALAAGLLSMHFHDCFVQGCDASVLVTGSATEKTAFANLGLRRFEVIDDPKTQLEAACPGVVSCADIVALAARDSVLLSGGLSWQVPTGRKDGRVSQVSDVNNLPAPTDSVDVQKQKFAAKGLNTKTSLPL
nr:cationic peroxidase 2-like [Arachis hypogaea]